MPHHDSVPLSTALSDVYSSAALKHQAGRWYQLAERFAQIYGHAPSKVARAPGRVCTIGEHIDYAGFGVMPSAIERDVLMAFSVLPAKEGVSSSPAAPEGKTKVILRNLNEDKYKGTEFVVDLLSKGDDLPMPETHEWSNYFIAGTKGILRHMNTFSPTRPAPDTLPPSELLVLVTGSVPEGSGLSSSSAITTASAILVQEAAARRTGPGALDRKEVTEVAIESERLVGVNSGGMDQSASMFSQVGHLLNVQFVPELSAKPVKLPATRPPASFVIANTLVHSPKKQTAKFNYNCRVVETRLAARLLAKHLKKIPLPPLASPTPLTLKAVVDGYFHPATPPDTPPQHPSNLATAAPAVPSSGLPGSTATHSYELQTMLGFAAAALGGPGMEDGLTWDEIAERLEEPLDEIRAGLVGKTEVEPRGGKFKVWTRCRHVLTEALRVYQFRELLEEAGANAANDTTEGTDSSELLGKLGELMDASMNSCQVDFECSCPELDELCALARERGALGSRLTGAGWGGATVHLVPESKAQGFLKALREEYYAKHLPDLTAEELEDVAFATKPESGAGVFEFLKPE